MEVRVFITMLIQLNTYLPYFLPVSPGQLVTSLPDDNIKEILYHAMPNLWGGNGRTGIQLLRWSCLIYGRVFQDQNQKSRNINPSKCFIKNKKIRKGKQ